MSKRRFTNYYQPGSGDTFSFIEVLEHPEESLCEVEKEEEVELKVSSIHIGIWEALIPNRDFCDLCDGLDISGLSAEECLDVLDSQKET